MFSRPDPPRAVRTIVAIAVTGLSAVVFWRTAYPTITWWDSSSYSLAAATLGITSSPGSLLLTLLGWPLARLPSGLTPAHVLNLLAGALAALAAGLVYVVALRVLRNVGGSDGADGSGATAIGAALGALTFAFSATLWEHAIKFTPYVLTAVFTALILWTMIRWWEDADRPDAWRWLALLTLLFGLDFSVHRTNALLIPGALAWILVRNGRTLLRPQSWLAGVGGLTAGLAVQLLVMPIAAGTRSPINMFEPSNWSRFWDYVSLAQTGGGFLIELWPRKSGFWSVQVADFLRVSGENFFHRGTPVGILGWLPALAAAAGLFMLWRRNRRLGIALTLVLFLHATMTVLYFNTPANYFRPFDRHYLPVFVTFAVAIACGMSVVTRQVAHFAKTRRRGAAALGAASVVLVPAAQLAGNWSAHDASRRYFARDLAANALGALPPNAIYFTVGDNDTFPVWYLQSVEGVRPDVRIVNLSLANASWYVEQIRRRDPGFPVALTPAQRLALSTVGWTDTTVVIPIAGTAEQLGLAADSTIPKAITVRPRPTVGTRIIPADVVLLDVLSTNRWRDPVTFAITVGDGALGWLKPYARLEGLFWRIIPVDNLRADLDILRANLLERYEYRGYADPAIRIDDVSRMMGLQYFTAFSALLESEEARGATDRCREARTKLFAALPPDRLALPARDREEIEARCRP